MQSIALFRYGTNMNKLLIFSFFVAGSLVAMNPQERRYNYLYPIDTIECEGQECVLTLWQKAKDITELYFCNTTTGVAHKELFSLFSPAGIQLLPSKRAYSFIDNGRIRIKELIKRSPATLAFDKPIFNISRMCWVDDASAYCHAQEGHRFGLYMFNREGCVQRLLYDQSHDYLFPSRAGDRLFYICRMYKNNQMYHAICAVPFEQNVPYDETVLYDNQEFIIQAGTLPIAFLRMQSEDLGFVLVHQGALDANEKTVLFHYYALEKKIDTKKVDTWRARQLFSFCVPSFLLDADNENRLYENMLPLLPHHDGTQIYYGSAHRDSQSMQIYCFDMASNCKTRSRVIGNRSQLLFCPRMSPRGLICGGSLVEGSHQFVPEVICNKNEDLKFKLVRLR